TRFALSLRGHLDEAHRGLRAPEHDGVDGLPRALGSLRDIAVRGVLVLLQPTNDEIVAGLSVSGRLLRFLRRPGLLCFACRHDREGYRLPDDYAQGNRWCGAIGPMPSEPLERSPASGSARRGAGPFRLGSSRSP